MYQACTLFDPATKNQNIVHTRTCPPPTSFALPYPTLQFSYVLCSHQVNCTEYLDRLLQTFKADDALHRRRIVDGAAKWLQYADSDLSLYYKRAPDGPKGTPGKVLKPERVDIVKYFRPFCEGSSAVIQPFALWALNILKNFLSNSRLEHAFSILTMFKSKYRTGLGDDKIRVPLVMATETPFALVAFEALWTDLEAWQNEDTNSITKKKLRGKDN
jgi:hypothetical protein